jgi:HTH-type transcriptional regulator / antitoxin HipB
MVTIWIAKNASEFGEAVRKARKREGLTQRELALAVGAGERFIVELENGKVNVRLGKALEVAAALGIQVALKHES